MTPRTRRPAVTDPVLAELIGRFDFDDVAKRIVAGSLTTITAYARMPDDLMTGEILDIVKHNLQLFMTCLREDREPDAEELDVLRASATQRGRDGVPLQDMLHGYRLGARVGWQALTELAATPEEQRVLLDIPDRIMRYIDGVSTAVEQSYLDEREHLVSELERWARAQLDSLLDPASGAGELQRLAELTGFGLAERYRPFAVSVPGAPPRAHSRIAIDLREHGVLALTEGDRVSGLAQPGTEPSTIARAGAACAVGEPTLRGELADGLAYARTQVQVARTFGLTGVLGAGDLLPELLLARSPALAAAIRGKVLDPLVRYAERRSSELVQTLVAFVECGLDRRATAAKLYVHFNTLDYRLRRIEQLTGLQLGDPEDLALVVLALKQRRLAG